MIGISFLCAINDLGFPNIYRFTYEYSDFFGGDEGVAGGEGEPFRIGFKGETGGTFYPVVTCKSAFNLRAILTVGMAIPGFGDRSCSLNMVFLYVLNRIRYMFLG